MYSKNSLSKLAQTLDKAYEIDLGSEYKNELFRGHINAAKQSLFRASELLGDKDIPLDWTIFLGRKMVIVFISLLTILLIFTSCGILQKVTAFLW